MPRKPHARLTIPHPGFRQAQADLQGRTRGRSRTHHDPPPPWCSIPARGWKAAEQRQACRQALETQDMPEALLRATDAPPPVREMIERIVGDWKRRRQGGGM